MPHEALIETFSSLSMKRRQGILRAMTPTGMLEIALIDGKIIGVEQPGGQAARDICQRLRRSGMIHEKVFTLFQSVDVTLSQLYDLLVSKKFVAPEKFNHARISYETDLLHSLRFAEDAVPEFLSRDVRPDPRYSLQLPLGQLLLDIFELNADDDRFRRLFFTDDGKPLSIKRKGERPKCLSAYESSLWDRLAESTRVDQLYLGLLSELEIREGLLVLVDLNLLEIELSAKAAHTYDAPMPKAEDDGLDLADVDESADDFFARLADDAEDSLLTGFDEDAWLGDIHDEALEFEAQKIDIRTAEPRKAEGGNTAVESPRPSIISSPSAEDDDALDQFVNAVEANDAKFEPAQNATQSIVSKLLSDKSLRTRVLDLNYQMIEKETRRKIIFCIVLAYLFAVLLSCILSNGMIDSFFRALSEFTSN